MKSRFVCILFSLFIILCFFGCPFLEELTIATPPENVVIQEVFSDGVIITWDYEYGMQSYVVYVSKTDSIYDASPIKVGLTDGAQITGLEPFTQYYFWITSVVFAGEGEPSKMVGAKTLIGAPKKVEISFENDVLNLTWDSVPNATDYLIYYGTEPSIVKAENTNYTPFSKKDLVNFKINDIELKDGVYYAWIYGRNNKVQSTYAATTSKRRGIPNYKFFIDEAPNTSESDFSLSQEENNTEVFMIKTNYSNNITTKNNTGGVLQNSVSTSKSYPIFSVVGSRISRTNELTTALQEDAQVTRVDHKLSQEFVYEPQKFVKSVKARNENFVQRSSSDFNSYSPNTRKKFWVDNANGQFSNKNATLIEEGLYCYVWVLDDVYLENSESKVDNKISLEQARAVANKFDKLYSAETAIFGQTYKDYYNQFTSSEAEEFLDSGYVLPEEKISILICDIYEDYSPIQNSGVLGYFWAKDFFDDNLLYEETNGKMYSNEAEIFYIDSHFLDSYTEMTYSTLAHEFQHMLNFVNKNLKWDVTPSTWYNEMLSMVCEDLLQDVIGIEDKDSPRSRLSSFNYGYLLNGINEWHEDDNVLYSYAHAYAFGAFITRNYGGADLVKAMTENKYVDLDSIYYAIKTTTESSISEEKLLEEFARALCYPEGFEGSEDDIATPLGKAYDADLKHFYRENSCTIDGFEYKLRPIRLADYHFGYYDENNMVQYKYGPYYLDVDKIYDLRPMGISVHSFGTGEFTFDYKAPTSSDVNVYFVIQ